jgi:hypothetical protein
VNLDLQWFVGVIVVCSGLLVGLRLLVPPLRPPLWFLGILLDLCTACFGQVANLLARTDCGILGILVTNKALNMLSLLVVLIVPDSFACLFWYLPY